MKSVNNYTEFDDILFYNVIIESFKKMFIRPVEKGAMTKTENNVFVFSNENFEEVKAVADGEIINIDIEKNVLEMKHENEIISRYKIEKIKELLKKGFKLQQGSFLGHSKILELSINIPVNKIYEK